MSSFKRLKSVVEPRCKRRNISSVESGIEIDIADVIVDTSESCSGCQVKRRMPDVKHGKKRPKKKATKKPSKPQGYTAFLAIQISDLKCHKNLRLFQDLQLKRHPEIFPTATPVSKSHVTLFMLNLDGEDGVVYGNLDLVKNIIERAVRKYKDLSEDSMFVELKTVEHFNSKVVFAKPFFSDNFSLLFGILAKELLEQGLIDEKSANFGGFKPHVTLFKMSKVRGKMSTKHFKDLPRVFPKDCFQNQEDVIFGSQKIEAIQLLSLRKQPEDLNDKYYYNYKTFEISESRDSIRRSDHDWCCRPLKLNENSVEAEESTFINTPKDQSSSSSFNLTNALILLGGGALALIFLRKYLTKD